MSINCGYEAIRSTLLNDCDEAREALWSAVAGRHRFGCNGNKAAAIEQINQSTVYPPAHSI